MHAVRAILRQVMDYRRCQAMSYRLVGYEARLKTESPRPLIERRTLGRVVLPSIEDASSPHRWPADVDSTNEEVVSTQRKNWP
jgi:hypothetical protein